MRPSLRVACGLPGAVVLLLLAPGCDLLTYRPPLGPDFGAPYEVRAGVRLAVDPGRVVETPALDRAHRLVAVVEYVGGCAAHGFRVEDDASANGRTVVWLVHDAGGDLCDAVVRDTLVVDLAGAFRPGPIAMATPGGDEILLTSLVGGE